jgi:hypothetical protein
LGKKSWEKSMGEKMEKWEQDKCREKRVGKKSKENVCGKVWGKIIIIAE